MTSSDALPIRRLTLYKHGVGYVQRAGSVEGEEVRLTFRAAEVNDALKSLLVIDKVGSKILGIGYETPADREARLADAPLRLGENASVLDLLRALRGWQVRLLCGEGGTLRALQGRLLGVDLAGEQESGGEAGALLLAPRGPLVALQEEETGAVAVIRLVDLRQIMLLEERAGQDLDIFLQASRVEEGHRALTIRLEPGAHDLEVSYLVPSPSWRVTYRLVAESAAPNAEGGAGSGTLLLQGWGLFDNTLEEDLRDVAVTLVAGQPISFIYDLAASRIPERPLIEDAARVAAAPVEFEPGAMVMSAPARLRRSPAVFEAAQAAMPGAPARMATTVKATLEQVRPAATSDLGELFAYTVIEPVTARRGESALAPILATALPYRRELLFNQQKLPDHPVAALRFTNATGLVLERGPITVLEDGEYRGEALVPFSTEGAEVYLAFAVELGIAITIERRITEEIAGLSIAEAMVVITQAVLTRTVYSARSTLATPSPVTIEHPIAQGAELTETPRPESETAQWYRWAVACPARARADFTVTERRLIQRSERLLDQSYESLRQYLHGRWLDAPTYERLAGLLREHAAIAALGREETKLQAEREAVYAREEQLRRNMAALGAEGDEGALRRHVVVELRRCEERVGAIGARLEALAEESARRQAALDAELAGLHLSRETQSVG